MNIIIEAERVAKPLWHRPVTPTISVGTEVNDTRNSHQLAVLSAKPESNAQAELKGIAEVGRDREARKRT